MPEKEYDRATQDLGNIVNLTGQLRAEKPRGIAVIKQSGRR